jgi:hypothetical protein
MNSAWICTFLDEICNDRQGGSLNQINNTTTTCAKEITESTVIRLHSNSSSEFQTKELNMHHTDNTTITRKLYTKLHTRAFRSLEQLQQHFVQPHCWNYSVLPTSHRRRITANAQCTRLFHLLVNLAVSIHIASIHHIIVIRNSLDSDVAVGMPIFVVVIFRTRRWQIMQSNSIVPQ